MSYYSLVLRSTYYTDLSNQAVNAFTYNTTEVVPTTAGAIALAQAFADLFFDDTFPLPAITSTDTVWQNITVKSPPVPTVLAIKTLGINGETAPPSDSPFVAAEFQSPRKLGNIRMGMKRFGLLSDVNVSGGNAVVGFLPFLDAVSAALSATLTATVSGVSVSFSPIVVKRIPYTTPSGSTAYRLPEGLDPFVFYVADNWDYTRITTQNSRKR